MNKIRVLHIIGSSNLGGGERLLCNLIKGMDKEKFEFFIVCPPEGEMIKDYQHCASEVKTLPVNKIWNLSALFQLWRYIKNGNFDIVHTHLYTSDLFGIIASKIAHVPVIISTVHGYNFSPTRRISLRTVKNRIFSLFYRIIYLFNDSIVAVCQAIKQDLTTRAGIRVGPEKIKVIYNGIDCFKKEAVAKINPAKLFKGLNGRTPLIGMIANFDPVKGHRDLIRAMPKVIQKVPGIKVLLVGDGEERKFIEGMIEKSKLSDSFIFTGTRKDVLEIISLCKLIVLPSLFEGFPLLILEAMALGKPIVASNVGGIPEVLENGKTAKLIPRNSPKHLSEAMAAVLEDESQASRMGILAKEKVWQDSRFHLANMAAQTEKLYLDLLDNKDSGRYKKYA